MGSSKYRTWNQDELGALRRGVHKHGAGNWEAIRNDPEFAETLATRSGEQIKDKWRNLIKFNHVSAEEAAACMRQNKRRGVKRSQTFDTAVTLQQRVAAGTLRKPSRPPGMSASEEMREKGEARNSGDFSPSDASSSDRNFPSRSGHRRPIKARSTVSDFRTLMRVGQPSGVPLAAGSARPELMNMGAPITTGALNGSPGLDLKGFEMELAMQNAGAMQQPFFSQGRNTHKPELPPSEGSGMQSILPELGSMGFNRPMGFDNSAGAMPFSMGWSGQQQHTFSSDPFGNRIENQYQASSGSPWGFSQSGLPPNVHSNHSRMVVDHGRSAASGLFDLITGEPIHVGQAGQHMQQQFDGFGQQASFSSTAAQSMNCFPPNYPDAPISDKQNPTQLQGSVSFGKLDFQSLNSRHSSSLE